jgi:hypothetical protein
MGQYGLEKEGQEDFGSRLWDSYCSNDLIPLFSPLLFSYFASCLLLMASMK